MESKLNKPRVFLSHSKKDEGFIGKLYNDLKKCQVDPWMDTEEIRDGRPWLKVIFEDGIPTCDVVLAYFTDNSVNSKMVGREIDAALVEQLSQKGISFLPYVNNEGLRARLRADIRALHCRLWNEANYSDVLPAVVAEIWHCYLERMIQVAVLQEKAQRLELELELSRQREKNVARVFSLSEDADFRNIFNQLNRDLVVSFDVWEGKDAGGVGKVIGKDSFKMNLCELITGYVRRGYYDFSHSRFLRYVGEIVKSRDYPHLSSEEAIRRYGNGKVNVDYFVRLKTYGMIRSLQSNDALSRPTHVEEFTDRLYRFLYWIEFNKYLQEEIIFDYLGFQPAEQPNS